MNKHLKLKATSGYFTKFKNYQKFEGTRYLNFQIKFRLTCNGDLPKLKD